MGYLEPHDILKKAQEELLWKSPMSTILEKLPRRVLLLKATEHSDVVPKRACEHVEWRCPLYSLQGSSIVSRQGCNYTRSVACMPVLVLLGRCFSVAKAGTDSR